MSSKQGPRVAGRRTAANAACHRHLQGLMIDMGTEVAA